jgi:type I restriction enzyme S subunit
MADIRVFTVADIPSLAIQRRIAAVLSAFDELIEINERRIALLEDLARSLYREWFVHFRFPDHEDVEFVDSEMGPIPEGWEVRRLADIAGVVVEGVDTADVHSGVPYLGLEHMPRRHTTLREWGSIESVTSRKLRFARGDTLFGKIRPYFHKVVWAPFDGVASSDAIVIRPLGDPGAAALVNAVGSSDALVARAVATSNGTKMPRADSKALLGFPMALPEISDELIVRFEQAAGYYLETAAELVGLNRTLAATRDLLLPRLVTGRLDISGVDLGDLLPADAA